MKCSRNLFSVASKVLSWPIDTCPNAVFFSKVIIKFPNLDVFAALKCAQGLNSKVSKEVRKMCEIV